MFKRLYIVFLCAILMVNLQAQIPVGDPVVLTPDTVFTENSGEEVMDEEVTPEEEIYDTILKVYPITISADSIQYWKNKKEFAYLKNLDSLLEASQKEEDQVNMKDNSVRPNLSWLDLLFNGVFFRLLLWGMAGIFIVIVLYQLFKNKGMFKQRTVKSVDEEVADTEENILEQDFDNLILKAKAKEDYRLATRYQFLKTLQRLKEKELIEFSLEKTNSLYVREVPDKWRNDFARLILNYEYVWYGKFDLTLQQYELLLQKYTSFNEKI